jgi:hypothetical protein
MSLTTQPVAPQIDASSGRESSCNLRHGEGNYQAEAAYHRPIRESLLEVSTDNAEVHHRQRKHPTNIQLEGHP